MERGAFTPNGRARTEAEKCHLGGQNARRAAEHRAYRVRPFPFGLLPLPRLPRMGHLGLLPLRTQGLKERGRRDACGVSFRTQPGVQEWPLATGQSGRERGTRMMG